MENRKIIYLYAARDTFTSHFASPTLRVYPKLITISAYIYSVHTAGVYSPKNHYNSCL